MKKLLAILVIAALVTGCNDSSDTQTTDKDTTKVPSGDSVEVVKDTTITIDTLD